MKTNAGALCAFAAVALGGCTHIDMSGYTTQRLAAANPSDPIAAMTPLLRARKSPAADLETAATKAKNKAFAFVADPACTKLNATEFQEAIEHPTLFDVVLAERTKGAAPLSEQENARRLAFSDRTIVQDVDDRVRKKLGIAKDSPVVKAAVKSYMMAAHPESATMIDSALQTGNVSKEDLQSLVDLLSARSAANSSDPAQKAEPNVRKSAKEKEIEFSDVLFLYYSNYFNKGFIDRHGTKISTPELSKSIKDADIANMTQVFLEALGDYVFRDDIPANDDTSGKPTMFYGGSKAGTPPTALSSYTNGTPLYLIQAKKTVAVDCPGLSYGEAKGIGYVGQLSGHMAVLNSGALFDALSSIHIGFIVAGNFGVGSNNTLSAVAKTAMQVVVQRCVEHYLQNGLNSLSAADAKQLQEDLAKLPGYKDYDAAG